MRSAEPQVSVVVAVYNAGGYLSELLDSLAEQDIGSGKFDVTLVDDGSTDGSSEFMDAYCASHRDFRVIHQANSGRPGGPRNVGIRASAGKYLFFADADDVLAKSCLRHLVAFADEHQSDIVIPRLTPLGGRTFPTNVFERTRIDTDLPTAFKSLFPQKLYRREFLAAHNIWFPEGRRMDDGILNAQAYVHAKRVSVLSDADYYFLRARQDGANLTRTGKNPATYTQSVADIAQTVRTHLGHSAMADEIVLELYRRKCLNQYGERFAGYDASTQAEWIAAHRTFAERFVTDGMEQALRPPFRERASFVRRGDRSGLLALHAKEVAPVMTAVVSAAAWRRPGLDVALDIAVEGRMSLPRQLLCTLVLRDEEGVSGFPLVRGTSDSAGYGQPVRYEGCLPHPSIEALLPGSYDVHIVSESAGERLTARVQWSPSVASVPQRGGFQFYSTKGGRAAVRKSD